MKQSAKVQNQNLNNFILILSVSILHKNYILNLIYIHIQIHKIYVL